MAGIQRWKEHTDSVEFKEKMLQIAENTALSNTERSAAMETFLLEEGERVGVVSEKIARVPQNPNRLGKYLAPWFGDACREAKKKFRNTCREHGRSSLEARAAYRLYIKTCKNARWNFARQLPDLLKYNPTTFWRMLQRGKKVENDVDTHQFAAFNE